MMSDSHNLMREYSISYCFICHFLVGPTSIFIAYLMVKGMAVKDPQSSLVNYLKKTYCRTFGSYNWKSRTFMSLCLGIKGRGLLLYKRTMFLDFIQVHTTSPASNQKKKKDQNSEVYTLTHGQVTKIQRSETEALGLLGLWNSTPITVIHFTMKENLSKDQVSIHFK